MYQFQTQIDSINIFRMPKHLYLQKRLLILVFISIISHALVAQKITTPQALNPEYIDRCSAIEAINEAIKNNPNITEIWRRKGQVLYQKYLQRRSLLRDREAPSTIVIPIVFHLVDAAEKLSWITDRDIYEQVEILNKTYAGLKADEYQQVIPPPMYARNGNVPIKFVLARQAPDGSLTSGIERRVHTTPGRKDIKSYATGGLDAWDDSLYLNVWAGTFSGEDNGLLGIATFPFVDTEGPQGAVINIATIPYFSNVSRFYYPAYSEGATLVHELGHYFYLWHTFGDSYECNNNDFRIQPGWPLPPGAGPEGDDTPEEKADSEGNAHYGNPSNDYSDGCTANSWGEMYSSFMNYFDDRAMFIFTEGHKKRILGCIELYRPGLITSPGKTPPVPVNDAYVVSISPRGIPERRADIQEGIPIIATLRNYGNTLLTGVTLTARLDASELYNETLTLQLAPGEDTLLHLGTLSGATGDHLLSVFSSAPNGVADDFPENDPVISYVNINSNIISAPFEENFSDSIFPPSGWLIWNPNENDTWQYSTESGFNAAGSATIQNYDYNGGGQLDELITPVIDPGAADSSLLTFNVAYATYDDRDVSLWDGLEIYVSNDMGANYHLVYKKSGNNLSTVSGDYTAPFKATPDSTASWRKDTVNLSPYLAAGKKLLLKFRGVNAYGNNIYLDDIHVSARVSLNRDVKALHVLNMPEYICGSMPTPSLSFRNVGKDVLTSLNISYSINGDNQNVVPWTGSLVQNDSAIAELPQLASLSPGTYLLKVFTSDLNGLNDEYTANDTATFRFFVFGEKPSPIFVGFEEAVFPPAGWVVQPGSDLPSWQRTTVAADSGVGSMVILNFETDHKGLSDNFISPVITDNGSYDSLFVSFDYAHAPGLNFPAPTRNPVDTLEVQVSMDCGQSFITIWKQWGSELNTSTNSSAASQTSFVPQDDEWKHIKIPMYPITGESNFQLFFRASGNNRNNLYLDDIRVYGVVVPQALKDQGYLLYPNPFHSQLLIRNYEQPDDLKSVQIYSSIGQLVWQRNFDGNAYKIIYADLAYLASGVYTVKMTFEDRVVVDRVIKL